MTTIEVTLAGLGVKQKDWLESSEFSGIEHTMVCVSRELDRAVVFNGLRWIAEWSGESDGLFSVVLSAVVSQASSQVVMLSEIPEMWPGDIVGGAVFIDCFSEDNVYDEGLGEYTKVANLAQAEYNLGIMEVLPLKSVNNAFETNGGNTFVDFGGKLNLKHLVMVVSPYNLDAGDMVILSSDGSCQLGLRVGGGQLELLDMDGKAISETIGDIIGAKSMIEINTETAPYMRHNGWDLTATKEAGWGDTELLRIGGPQGDAYKGEIYGLFAAVRELTSSERNAVVAWMKKRYGITGW